LKLIAITQYHENYEFDADGSPVLPGYWKAKGGTEYVVARNISSVEDTAELQALVDAKRSEMEWDNPASRSYIIDWYICGDARPTQWESDQLEFEGSITSPSPDLSEAA
jgi:hypothetical protein